MHLTDTAELEAEAIRRLPPTVSDYFNGGAWRETTVRDNTAAWATWAFHPRVLVDASRPALATTLLGTPTALPIAVAPTAMHGLAHPDAERGTAGGAADAGTLMTLSTLSNTPMEAVSAQGAPWWFQLYVYKDRGATEALVARARAAGARALVLTADAPRIATRPRDVRNGFALPAELGFPNAASEAHRQMTQREEGSSLAAYVAEALDPALTWRDVAWLAGISGLPVVVKGVLRADDARAALDHGAAAVAVSNHGGRQLDGAVATAHALPAVVDAVAGRCEVYVDGGLRRGTDVLAALALGARAVFLGRPVLWALATGGRPGVAALFGQLGAELAEAMSLAGVPDVTAVPRDLVERRR